MNFTLLDLDNVLRSIGRGVVFYSTRWTTGDISLTHLGDTEGDIVLNPNESFVSLTTPELTGAAPKKAYVEGAAPTITIPLYMADPATRAIVSPTGTKSAGFSRRRPVTEYTLAIFPEELFYDQTDKAYEVLAYTTAGGWTVGGSALTAAQIALLGQTVWAWRGYFSTAPITLRHGDAGKAVESVTFTILEDDAKPEGHRLFTIGDPALATPTPIVIDAP